ncbi:MAG: GxxExxY protein [Opitutaceae bacterium]
MDLLFKQEVFATIAAAIEVHRELGPGFHEAVYQEAFERELTDRKIPFEAQRPITIFYKRQPLLKSYTPDLIVFGEIIIELKTLDRLTSKEESQLLNYLTATKKPLRLLVNFGAHGRLEWKRMIH